MSVPNLNKIVLERHAQFWPLTSPAICGLFTEAVARDCHAVDPDFGHLRKFGAQTQFNGHAVDVILHKSGHAIDIIIASKKASPKTPSQPTWAVEHEALYADTDRFWMSPAALPSGDEEDDALPETPRPMPPPVVPAPLPPPAPSVTADEFLEAGRQVGRALEQSPAYRATLEGTCEAAFHLAWGVLQQGRTLDEIIADAKARAGG